MAVRAQYAAGHAGGEDVRLPGGGRRAADSTTETYAALRLEVDNWRWAGVPFYLRTGKRLARKVTEIAVTLKPVPHLAFSQDGSLGVQPNQLVLTLQPNEGVSLRLGAKIPGTRMIIRPVNMEFLYGTAFLSQSPEAYERLITDAMRGDATLFTRNDEVEAQWRICDPIVGAWAKEPGRCRSTKPARRARGGRQPAARGPALARDLMARSDAVWSAAGHDARRDRSGAARAARRAPRRKRQLRPGARAEHDRVRRRRVERRDRQPPARRRALRTPRACSCSPTSRAASAWTRARRSPPKANPPRRAGAAARDGDRPDRRSPPRRPADDRRPARRHRPAHAAVVSARPSTRPSTRCSAWRRRCWWTRSRSPTVRRGDRARMCARAAGSTSWTSRGCARPRGASASRPPSTPARSAANCADRRVSGPAPSRLDGRRDAARRLARLAAGLGDRPAHSPRRRAVATPRHIARTWRCAWRPHPSSRCVA